MKKNLFKKNKIKYDTKLYRNLITIAYLNIKKN